MITRENLFDGITLVGDSIPLNPVQKGGCDAAVFVCAVFTGQYAALYSNNVEKRAFSASVFER